MPSFMQIQLKLSTENDGSILAHATRNILSPKIEKIAFSQKDLRILKKIKKHVEIFTQ